MGYMKKDFMKKDLSKADQVLKNARSVYVIRSVSVGH